MSSQTGSDISGSQQTGQFNSPTQNSGCLDDFIGPDPSIDNLSYVDEELNKFFTPEHSSSNNQSQPGGNDESQTVLPQNQSQIRRGVSSWIVPEHYKSHWERVPETIKYIPLSMTVVDATCMTPQHEHVGKMFSESKCLSLMHENSQDRMTSPFDGPSYCFVSECYAGIPYESQKAIFFFDQVIKILRSRDRYPYVFPTDKIGLTICRKTQKTVTSLFTKIDKSNDEEAFTERQQHSQHSKTCIKRFLESRSFEQAEEARIPIPDIRLKVGFTGASYRDSNGEVCHKNFCVVIVTPAANLMLWPFIFEELLIPPKIGSPHYAMLMEIYLGMKSTLEEVINFELVRNLGVNQHEFGTWTDYKYNSGGVLGVNTILSMFLIPAKIWHRITEECPGATDIQILGMPQFNFSNEDTRTTDWIQYMHRSINCIQRMEGRDFEALQSFIQTKDKSIFQEVKQECPGGWPMQVSLTGEITVYGLPPLPIMLNFSSHGALLKGYDTWVSSNGGKDFEPVIVRALLRSYLIDTKSDGGFPNISHFLFDTRPADHVLLFNTYFSASADPFKTLMLKDSQKLWWDSMIKDIKHRRGNGIPVREAIYILQTFIKGAVLNLRSMIANGSFRSKTISQMMFICDTIDIHEVSKNGEKSIWNRLNNFRQKVSPNRRYDRIDCTLGALLDTFREINTSFYLNPANLSLLFEIMVSRILYKFGGINDTWTYFFAMIMVMSGNGHFKTVLPGGEVIKDNRKPNSKGTDNAINREHDLINNMYDLMGIPRNQRELLMQACSRFTPTVWEQASTASAAPSSSTGAMELFTQPPSELNGKPLYMSERRGDSLDPLIKDVCQRNEAGTDNIALNSSDPKAGSNQRVLTVKKKVEQPEVIVTCSNVLDTRYTCEPTQTIGAVSDVLTPGSGPASNKRTRTDFHDLRRDINTGRHREVDDKRGVSNFVVHTHILASVYIGLTNRLRATPAEINQVTAALVEWAMFYLQQFCEELWDSTVRENISRMIQGYTSRGVALSSWVKTIDHFSRITDSEDLSNVINKLLQDVMVDVLPNACVPYVLTRIISRALNMGALLIITSICLEMKLPIISWDGLNKFFDDDLPPNETDDHFAEYTLIRNFFVQCINSRRFAPDEDADWDSVHNVSCYITGDGRENLLPLHENKGFLRFTYHKDRHGEEHTLLYKISTRFAKMKGRDLFHTCHMGPETHSYRLAFEDLLKYMVDLRGLVNGKIFHSRKHFEKMGLLHYLPGLSDYEDPEALPFAKHVFFKECGHIKSEAFAINPWAALTLMSLAGQTAPVLVHPSINDSIAAGLVTQVLSKAPPGYTPANALRTRIFGMDSKAIRIFPSKDKRPMHFIRPLDESFPANGILPLARAMEQYLPEDMCHCPWLFMLSKLLACGVMEVPANAVQSPYNLQPNKHYLAHNPENEGVFATVYVDTEEETVIISESTRSEQLHEICDGKISKVGLEDWEDFLRKNEYVIVPMIERGGACVTVLVEEAGVNVLKTGVLIYYPETESQINHNFGTYQALIDSENTVVEIFFKDVYRDLIPVGTVMYLRMEVIEDKYPRRLSATGKFLHTRLNVPNVTLPPQGKVYVTAAFRHNGRHARSTSASAVTLEVNPWDIIPINLFQGGRDNIVKYLD